MNLAIVPLLRWGGAMLFRSGNVNLASLLYRAAEDLSPNAAVPFAYARFLWKDGQYASAKKTLQKILTAKPLQHDSTNLMGVLLFEEGDLASASALFRQAIKVQPNFAAAHNNLGNVYRANLELEAAERCYRTALEHQPDYAESMTNLGATLTLQGKQEEAESCCRRAVELQPDFAGAHCNLGSILLIKNQTGEALVAYREALRLQPNLPDALINMALVMDDPGYLVGTIDYYEKQHQRQPNNYVPYMRIAQALQVLDRWDDARHQLEQALELKPDAIELLTLLAINYEHIGDVCRGTTFMRRVLDAGPHNSAQSWIIFKYLYLEEYSGEQLCAEYRKWAESWATKRLLPTSPRDKATQDRRLRIGYVSRDFAKHSVAFFFEPILKHHDRHHFEVFCYSTLIRGDDYTEKFKSLADTWRDISTLSENQVLEMIRVDEIDILVDLSGHTLGNRLGVFAKKPAPVQVTYLGHPATTGIDAIDYRLGDAITDPREMTEHHYVEQLWQLPGCFLTYNPPPASPEVVFPPSLTNGYVTFGSFNNIAKVNEHVIAAWANILSSLPTSRLKLKAFAFASEKGRTRIVEGFARHGIASDRVELIDWRPDIQNHLELYGEIDIALDTFPYNGTTTTCEALWMGVPVICVEGKRHSARVGASLLAAIGMPELVASDTTNFVRVAVELANNPGRVTELRANLRNKVRHSALLDHAEFTAKLEHAYQEMWAAYCLRRKSAETPAAAFQPGFTVKTVSLDLAGVATICVPDSLEVMTRYVVEEQGDWFEEEIRFVRKLLAPGQVAIDVGANYGVYTLSMAAIVGPVGRVFSFEPSASTAQILRESINANNFQNITVIDQAVSDIDGLGHFKQEAHAELSRLVDAVDSTDTDDAVEMSTLDRCRHEFNWDRIDFIKIDAEGQEPNVVRGGGQVLADLSPLVMAEYKHGSKVNSAVLDEFSRLGFQTYRLIPGLQLLAPIEDIAQADPYLLNLFFCKQDQASKLAARGFLAAHDDGNISLATRPMSGWRDYLSGLEYARGDQWQANMATCESLSSAYEAALDYYALAQRDNLRPRERLAALEQAVVEARTAVQERYSIFQRMTLARMLADYGSREEARKEFMNVLKAFGQGGQTPDIPFLAPSSRFEQIEPQGNLTDWAIAAVAEWLASNTGFSSFFTLDESLRYLQRVRGSGYFEVEAERRIKLILQRKRGAILP